MFTLAFCIALAELDTLDDSGQSVTVVTVIPFITVVIADCDTCLVKSLLPDEADAESGELACISFIAVSGQ